MIAENLKIVTIKIDFFISINIIPFLCLQKGFSNDSKKNRPEHYDLWQKVEHVTNCNPHLYLHKFERSVLFTDLPSLIQQKMNTYIFCEDAHKFLYKTSVVFTFSKRGIWKPIYHCYISMCEKLTFWSNSFDRRTEGPFV